MTRFQRLIEKILNGALERRARLEGRFRTPLMWQFVRARPNTLPAIEADLVSRLVGVDDFEPEGVDDVVYR
jgi:hypothetical protein